MAVLDNQAIPQMLLAKGEALEMAEIDAIQVLLDFSLIKGDEQYRFFSMHPLQQLVSGSDPENICLPGRLLVTCLCNGLSACNFWEVLSWLSKAIIFVYLSHVEQARTYANANFRLLVNSELAQA